MLGGETVSRVGASAATVAGASGAPPLVRLFVVVGAIFGIAAGKPVAVEVGFVHLGVVVQRRCRATAADDARAVLGLLQLVEFVVAVVEQVAHRHSPPV